jgi:hypothetical protein
VGMGAVHGRIDLAEVRGFDPITRRQRGERTIQRLAQLDRVSVGGPRRRRFGPRSS